MLCSMLEESEGSNGNRSLRYRPEVDFLSVLRDFLIKEHLVWSSPTSVFYRAYFFCKIYFFAAISVVFSHTTCPWHLLEGFYLASPSSFSRNGVAREILRCLHLWRYLKSAHPGQLVPAVLGVQEALIGDLERSHKSVKSPGSPSPFQLVELELQPAFERHLHQNRSLPLISHKCWFKSLNSVICCHHLFLLATRDVPTYGDLWKTTILENYILN